MRASDSVFDAGANGAPAGASLQAAATGFASASLMHYRRHRLLFRDGSEVSSGCDRGAAVASWDGAVVQTARTPTRPPTPVRGFGRLPPRKGTVTLRHPTHYKWGLL